ncbi:MAG: TIR domain-containing protein [Ruminococcaceae bacterium]|nr:TIR domain-containing protein [Oscillospiraceae bacterium]
MAVYEGAENFIFVSYAHKDTPSVVPVIQGLQQQGFRIWYDSGIEAGSEWPEYIAEHLESAAVVLVFMSPAATASRNCRNEINYALELGKDILVAYIEHTTLTGGMRLQLSSTQALYRDRHTSLDSFLGELSCARIMQPCKGAVDPVPEKTDIPIWKMIPSEVTSLGDLNYDAGKYKEAVACYRRGAEAGDPYGKAGLAKCMYDGKGCPKDQKKAYELAKPLAEQGVPSAECLMGICYYEGNAVIRNYEQSAFWLKKAVKHGSVPALANLALLYRNGYGVPKDPKKAVELYRRGVELDSALAYNGLSLCYMNGVGVVEDPVEAVRLCRKAAEKGNKYALYNMGLWHKLGKGVPKDPEEALRWFRLAEEAGNTNARGQVDALMAEKARADALRGAAESGGGYVCTVCGHRMVGVLNKCPVCDSSRDHFKIVT